MSNTRHCTRKNRNVVISEWNLYCMCTQCDVEKCQLMCAVRHTHGAPYVGRPNCVKCIEYTREQKIAEKQR